MTEDVRDIDSGATEPEADEALTDAPMDEGAYEVEADSPAPDDRVRRGVPAGVRRIGAVVLAVLLLISGGVATWLYFKQYRPDQQTDTGVTLTVTRAASDGAAALLSYSADSLDRDFAAAKSHLGGEFLSYYDQYSQHSVAPVAKQKSMKSTAKVTGAAVSELHPDSAVVLVFVDRVTTTKDNPQPSVAVLTVLVGMSRISGDWLITRFTPI